MQRPEVGSAVDRLVASAAEGMNRRRFLRRVGGGALGFSMAAALAGATKPSIARAVGSQGSPCGPSPICPSYRCDPVNCLGSQNCARRGPYGSSTPYNCTSSYSNSWVEDYRPTGGSYWHCADCCCTGLSSGTVCPNCTGRRACICRFKIA